MNRLVLLLSLLLIGGAVSAQPLTTAERTQTTNATLALLNDRYVFPEVAKRMDTYVRSRQRTYDTITDGQTLARQLTSDLRTICHDKHLTVNYFPEGVPSEQLWQKTPTEAELTAQKAAMQKGLLRENFGILGLSVLKGNLGYLNFKYLAPPEIAGDSYVAALNYLAQTDALIIDLRQCGGAISEHAIPLLCSYFFAEPTHLNSFYWRDGNRLVQSWTYAQVPGRRYLDKPIYILTSRQTFSGAEELAYDLAQLKRATLVGDTTGGGANPGGTLRINDRFAAFVPVGRAINPITQTNWEGVGVAPDTVVPANRALYAAQLMAVRTLANKPGIDPDWRAALLGIMGELERTQPRYVTHSFVLKGHANAHDVRVAGSFNDWSAQANRLVRRGDAWVADVEVLPGKISYKFIVDGQWLTDPANPRTEGDGQYTNSVFDIAER
ncbi:Retinol-binding protein 3 Interphotoreceptor retinoid-binding protein [Fibrella aestuarina BUZ 2]|uniref:Retinol-binding protein 3 Interphotoreceptor retinoid-binding protein n=1 Tax=Fibrella aestuarina BUZ 2 TaxID=1166018 RepID=I0KG71_9BACT|nr:S41 family peptidase [Fibrella aestuarina]CCH03124.1 Retinol-binding protein 3 Interphotoreceptor retinoid-binding protein [Fibrella aestuarina BUZ 2]